eukprot:GGOE01014930.1.p1 GENE.GGOE01014930.1~~GGOE01014930.1.p1  ORF type:complete len:580 (-),score=108.49 GGOE01014930.1:42-1556(-)
MDPAVQAALLQQPSTMALRSLPFPGPEMLLPQLQPIPPPSPSLHLNLHPSLSSPPPQPTVRLAQQVRPMPVIIPRPPEHVQVGGSAPMRSNPRWRRPIIYECKLCAVVAHSVLDRDAHTSSRDHVRRLLEREQRAVLVLGLPAGATAQEVRMIFEGFCLAGDAVQYVPGLAASGPPSDSSDGEAGLAEPGCWHVLLNTVDDARRAAKTPPTTVGDHTVSIALAVQPHQCHLCHVTLNSAAQLQQHVKGSRHQGQLRQYAACCSIVLTGVPLHATADDVRSLFAGCEEVEGSLIMQTDPEGLSQVVCVTFVDAEQSDRAFSLCKAHPMVADVPIEVLRKRDPPPPTNEQVPVTSGVKTTREAHQLVCSLLQDHRIRNVDDLNVTLFSRLTSIFLSCTPSPLAGMHPRDRFFTEFDSQAGSKHGAILLANALALLRHMEHDWPFPLPACAQAWVQRRIAKYCPPAKLVKKAVFAQLRNTICTAYQATEQVMHLLAGTPLQGPHPPY